MLAALAELQHAFRELNAELALYQGLPSAVITQAFENYRIQAVFVNRDYTPFSRQRDAELAHVCQALGIAFHCVADCLLLEPEQAVKSDGLPYQVFTPFYNNARRIQVALPKPLVNKNFIRLKAQDVTVDLSAISVQIATSHHPDTSAIKGGRSHALNILEQLATLRDYQQQRDFPGLGATSHLSAHLKFGTCSVREAYHAIAQQLSEEHPLIRQLYWRDFFSHIAFYFPQVFGKPFHSRYDTLAWDNNLEHFQRWQHGMTGFPIVDAGMRELSATGYMHNRVRMIVASFLTKDLHISWRWGERHFAQRLVDYDPAVNNGNWQWAASTGCDAQPYYRIFNPWLQQQKFDPDCRYIYRWLPELAGIPVNVIHNWHRQTQGQSHYPAPMLDHNQQSKLAKARFSACSESFVSRTQE